MYADVSELSIGSIESSETPAYINTLTPGTYPKEKKLHTDTSVYSNGQFNIIPLSDKSMM